VLTECGSVGFCAVGPAVMVYPDGVWYAQVRASDVTEIIEEHLINNRPGRTPRVTSNSHQQVLKVYF
jgi:(2Fe-2S) ferredoxin